MITTFSFPCLYKCDTCLANCSLALFVCFQVDIFVIDSVFLGKLTSIRIGHSETKLGKFLITFLHLTLFETTETQAEFF